MGEMSTERELDAAIARKVFGLNPEMRVIRLAYFELEEEISDEMTLPHDPPFEHERDWAVAGASGEWWDTGHRLPRYSTDIAAAWQVIDKLRERFPQIDIEILPDRVTVTLWEQCRHDGGALDPLDEVVADTIPLAICRAALQAVDVVPESV